MDDLNYICNRNLEYHIGTEVLSLTVTFTSVSIVSFYLEFDFNPIPIGLLDKYLLRWHRSKYLYRAELISDNFHAYF